mmetsp:Transcript_75045/g.242672  ORF Transcript_75045/g.242672 Transcript_75045/m.242672 type:complete len:373 (+) Transcript_75045:29-1147(+)
MQSPQLRLVPQPHASRRGGVCVHPAGAGRRAASSPQQPTSVVWVDQEVRPVGRVAREQGGHAGRQGREDGKHHGHDGGPHDHLGVPRRQYARLRAALAALLAVVLRDLRVQRRAAEDPAPVHVGRAQPVGLRHGPPGAHRDVRVEVPDDGAEALLVELVHVPVGQAVVVEEVVALPPRAVAAQRVLGDEDVVHAVLVEGPDGRQVAEEATPGLLLVRDLGAGAVDVRGEEDAPVVLVGERLLPLPPGQLVRPLHDDEGHLLAKVLPRNLDGADVEFLQVLPRDVAVGLVQQLHAVALLAVVGADLGHDLHGAHGDVPVPVGVEEVVALPLVAAGEHVVRLAARRPMQVQHHLQLGLPGILEDKLDPLEVVFG